MVALGIKRDNARAVEGVLSQEVRIHVNLSVLRFLISKMGIIVVIIIFNIMRIKLI